MPQSKILLLAPHPFYQERGTPIAVDLLVRVLSESGRKIDLLTYHEGEDRTYAGSVTISRIKAPPLARNIRPGFSTKKLLCDAAMRAAALHMARQGTYGVVHAVEESVFIAMTLKRRYGIPYVYDMDSSLPRQMADRFAFLRPLMPLMTAIEKQAIRSAMAVVPMCDSLAAIARSSGAGKVTVLRDISLLHQQTPTVSRTAAGNGLLVSGPCIMYVGNLEQYQGIDLLLTGFARLIGAGKEATLAVVGGRKEDVERYEKRAHDLGIGTRVRFMGPKPLSEMGLLFDSADILVSPRLKGTNTPMKIYSYMDSGKPILATDIPSHTQVLDSATALLTAPNPTDFAAGMQLLLENPALRKELGSRAKATAQEKHCVAAFSRSILELYDWVDNHVAAAPSHAR